MIDTAFTRMTGVPLPLVAFNRSPAVVVEASRAGAFGVLAATAYTAEQLDAQLHWIEEQLDGAPYGVDLLVPERSVDVDLDGLVESLRAQIPAEHLAFVATLMEKYAIPPLAAGRRVKDPIMMDPSMVSDLLDVCFSHDISLIANALGTPPAQMTAGAQERGIPVAALVGKPEHAVRQLAAGVDLLVAQGYEAGGHTGEIASLVLTPEIVALAGDTPVLTAGGIGSGDQLAAALALGAAGGWAGSVWLSSVEDVANAALKDKFFAATSSDTVRSRARTGKPARQLKSSWHDEWSAPGAPAPLPMPLQPMLTLEAWERIDTAAERGEPGALDLESYFIGQIVGSLGELRTTRAIVETIARDLDERLRLLSGLIAPAGAAPPAAQPADATRIVSGSKTVPGA